MNEDVIDAEHTQLAITQPKQSLEVWTPSFAIAVDDMIERVAQKHRFYKSVMKVDQHYGVIPGTTQKPTLLKSGAELLLSSMGLYAELADETPPVVDYDGSGEGHGEPLIRYHQVCRIYRQVGPTELERVKIAQSSGTCSSREKKYRYRDAQRKCPKCGVEAIFTSKNAGEGFYCWKKKGGCGAQFDKTDPAIASQDGGKVPNPELADVENTILKMAQKRALVGATLIATGCSDIFTQDVNDPEVDDETPPEPKARPSERDSRPPSASRNDGTPISRYSAPPNPEEAPEPKKTPITFKALGALNTLTADGVLTPSEQERVTQDVAGVATFPEIRFEEDARLVYAALLKKKAEVSKEQIF